MKQTMRYYAPIAGLLAGIVALSAVLTVLVGGAVRRQDKPVVMTTVYPLYVAAQAVIGDTDGVSLAHLSGSAGGCLHDYQLSPADRLSLQQAELLLLNGAGAETFLEDVLPTLSARVVDTAEGLSLLCADHHHEGHDHDHAEEAYNEHLWTSPTRYAAQVEQVTAALCALDPAHEAEYTANGTAYRQQVLTLGEQLRTVAAQLPSASCITFHSSLAYLVEDCGLHTVCALQIGEESGVSASHLSAAQQALTADPNTVLIYDSQYDLRYTALRGKTAVLDTAVTTPWLSAMDHNLKVLQSLTEVSE